MNKFQFLLFAGLFTSPGIESQIINKEPLSIRQTYYKIDAKLEPVSKSVTGSMETFWVNNSTDIVPDVQLHLYMNAFRNSKTTFNRESVMRQEVKDSVSGWIDIKLLTDKNGKDLTGLMQYISPDDGNKNDRTVLKIILPKAARPGDTVFLKIDFETKLPSRIIRTGYTDDYFFVGQWFPKFGVYESSGMRYATKGGWNCHQFHANSEFYSNHSVYDVKITVPKEYVVGTGGLLMNEPDTANGKKTMIYRAEDIVDFAWTAWPSYVVFTDQWEHVSITLLLPPERKIQAERQMKAVKNALEYLTKNVGPYPWPYLTFVDPPSKGGGAGGMEYTTLFTSDSFTGIPDYLHIPEMVTIHEFGHAYFMGIMASNEFEEPWLDEGVNTYWEGRIVDQYYGKNSGLIDLPYFKVADITLARITYVASSERQTSTNIEYSWNYPHNTYGMMSYNKPAVILHTLTGLVGEETMNEIFREYYKKWAFRHPSGKDFINVVNEVVTREHGDKFGKDMNWFFDQTLYGTGICDYKVSDIRSDRTGYSSEYSTSKDTAGIISADAGSTYKSVVEIERAGEVMLPVEVLVHFSNGDEILELWDGKSRFKDFTFERKESVQWVKIDPDYKIKMDVNYINNSMTMNPDRIPVRRLTNKFITFMQFFISFISL
jgi:hypothetical protein